MRVPGVAALIVPESDKLGRLDSISDLSVDLGRGGEVEVISMLLFV
jgi:hypothetical protein